MPEYTYTKSITTDFGGNFDSSNLKDEVVNGIAATLLRVDTLGDAVYIVFDAELTSGEEDTLTNTVIQNHSPSVAEVYTIAINNIINKQSTKSSYQRICTFVYEGSILIGSIKQISGIAYIDSNATDYTILVEDVTNDQTLAEQTYTNKFEDMIELSTITNVPTGKSKIEVSVKRTSSKNNAKVYVESLTFYI